MSRRNLINNVQYMSAQKHLNKRVSHTWNKKKEWCQEQINGKWPWAFQNFSRRNPRRSPRYNCIHEHLVGPDSYGDVLHSKQSANINLWLMLLFVFVCVYILMGSWQDSNLCVLFRFIIWRNQGNLVEHQVPPCFWRKYYTFDVLPVQ